MNLLRKGDALEWIHIEVNGEPEKFLQGDYLWTDDHQHYPYYRKKYIFIDAANPNLIQCALYWNTHEQWHSMDPQRTANLYQAYYKMIGHLLVSQVQITTGLRSYLMFVRSANDHQLPQPLLAYSLENITDEGLKEFLSRFPNPIEVWFMKEGLFYLIINGSLPQDGELDEFVRTRLLGKLAHTLTKTHYFPPLKALTQGSSEL